MEYMIAENIKKYKEINNLSVRETAKKIKISHVVVSQFINRKRNSARIDIVCKIAQSMGVEIDDLLFNNIYIN